MEKIVLIKNGTEKILNESQVQKYQKLKSEILVFLAKRSVYVAQELESVDKEVDYFIKLLACSKAQKTKIDPTGLSLKTLDICYQLMEEKILPLFYVSYPKLGMTQNERLSTPKISECHNQESEFSLSQVLEKNVEEKYFLSPTQLTKLIEKSPNY